MGVFMRLNKKGIIAVSIIYSFFLIFTMLLILIMSRYLNTRVLLNEYKLDIKKSFYSSYNVTEYDSPGSHTFTSPSTGYYKLELWGASGGDAGDYHGGYGGYATGIIYLNANQTVHIYVGGAGKNASTSGSTLAGGANGGGSASADGICASGGGATHIASINGELSALESNKSSVIIVAGGGGGAYDIAKNTSYLTTRWGDGASGGGYIGGYLTSTSGLGNYNLNAGKQDDGYKFGKGEDGSDVSGGGGGYYGGYSGQVSVYVFGAGEGGSGYIGYSNLLNKTMVCYDCSTSNAEGIQTENTTCHDSSPISLCAKDGDGYVKITSLA